MINFCVKHYSEKLFLFKLAQLKCIAMYIFNFYASCNNIYYKIIDAIPRKQFCSNFNILLNDKTIHLLL